MTSSNEPSLTTTTATDRLKSWVRRPSFWGCLFVAWFALLFYLSSGPVTIRTGFTIPHADKVAHFIYFAGGGTGLHLLLRFHPRTRGFSPIKRVLIVVTVIALFGWFDEWHQSWVPARTGNDFHDWLADVLGGITSFFIALPIGRMIERRTNPSPQPDVPDT